MKSLKELLDLRFGDMGTVPDAIADNPALITMAGRGVVRRFKPEPVPAAMLDTLSAIALSAPSKSDLQQRDILIVEDGAIRGRINALLKDQDWVASCPHILVFLGNNRRQRQVHQWRGHAFANDHLDAFFNASVDAAIALQAFVFAAEAAGLGCCPISVIRNHAEEVSGLLGLPDHVFPVAGLGVGWPSSPAFVSARLPLGLTVHRDRYTEATDETVRGYDRRRNSIFPYRAQRNVAKFGTALDYGWSEEKARHYAVPERADFGAYVKRRGFRLE
ncbi:MAG: nitroreductase family protein [Hyphomicrobiaceae bacterium]|nr:nitroreductase family protein [Hyphomicrobiaceae bacterium]